MTNLRIHPLWGPFGGCEERFASGVLITHCISAGLCNLMGTGPPLVSFSRLLGQFTPGLRFNASPAMNCPCQLSSVIAFFAFPHVWNLHVSCMYFFFFLSCNLHSASLCLLMFSGFQAWFNNNFGFCFFPSIDWWRIPLPVASLKTESSAFTPQLEKVRARGIIQSGSPKTLSFSQVPSPLCAFTPSLNHVCMLSVSIS